MSLGLALKGSDVSLVEWAFAEEIPTAEKLVLVWIATNASSNGIAPQYRKHLAASTGYKKRSIQRLLRSLKDSGHLQERGDYFVIGPQDPVQDLAADSVEQLPDELAQLPDHAENPGFNHGKTIDAEAIGEAVAKHVIDAAEYHLDQLQAFEARLAQQFERMVLFHVEHQGEAVAPPPDAVLVNPLYQQLLDGGMNANRAYALSQADLDMEHDDEWRPDYKPLFDEEPSESKDSYSNDPGGRFDRILDILHGSDAPKYDQPQMRKGWNMIEAQESKHTVDGETDAFLLIYPAIVAAAKANIGKLSISEFCNPTNAAKGLAPWDREIDPIDKDDPALMVEISTMLAELEQTNDPRCQVQPRTKETGDDGIDRTETALGFHRRVRAKYNQMLQLKEMGAIG